MPDKRVGGSSHLPDNKKVLETSDTQQLLSTFRKNLYHISLGDFPAGGGALVTAYRTVTKQQQRTIQTIRGK